MAEFEKFKGPARFGRAYERMYLNDSHTPGSVDWRLIREMVFLCAETVEFLYRDFTPRVAQYLAGSRPELEAFLAGIAKQDAKECVREIARRCVSLGENASDDLRASVIGGGPRGDGE